MKQSHYNKRTKKRSDTHYRLERRKKDLSQKMERSDQIFYA